MSVLFMMPQWKAASEVWMQRMLDALSQDLAALAVNDTQGSRTWKGKIPAISLYPPEQEIRYLSRLFELSRLSLKRSPKKAEKILLDLLKQLPIEKIFCQYGVYASKFMNIWRETDIPLFVHFHGYDVFFDLRAPDQSNKPYYDQQYASNIKELENRAVFIAGSQFLKSQLVDAGISPEKVIVKYYGVPVPQKKRVHTQKEKIQILHLGRFVDFKSPDRTIQAFEIARSKGLDANLVMVGDGPLKMYCELLRLRSPYKDSIQFLNSVSNQDAQALYAESDIFTQHNMMGELTRQSEGFGVVMLEAAACGLPIVGTKSGGIVESVADGKNGILNTPGDVEAQADAFLLLGRNPDLRQQMGDAGHTHVSNSFSAEREAKQLREILNLPSLRSAG